MNSGVSKLAIVLLCDRMGENDRLWRIEFEAVPSRMAVQGGSMNDESKMT